MLYLDPETITIKNGEGKPVEVNNNDPFHFIILKNEIRCIEEPLGFNYPGALKENIFGDDVSKENIKVHGTFIIENNRIILQKDFSSSSKLENLKNQIQSLRQCKIDFAKMGVGSSFLEEEKAIIEEKLNSPNVTDDELEQTFHNLSQAASISSNTLSKLENAISKASHVIKEQMSDSEGVDIEEPQIILDPPQLSENTNSNPLEKLKVVAEKAAQYMEESMKTDESMVGSHALKAYEITQDELTLQKENNEEKNLTSIDEKDNTSELEVEKETTIEEVLIEKNKEIHEEEAPIQLELDVNEEIPALDMSVSSNNLEYAHSKESELSISDEILGYNTYKEENQEKDNDLEKNTEHFISETVGSKQTLEKDTASLHADVEIPFQQTTLQEEAEGSLYSENTSNKQHIIETEDITEPQHTVTMHNTPSQQAILIEELTKPQQATLLKETDAENIPQDEEEAEGLLYSENTSNKQYIIETEDITEPQHTATMHNTPPQQAILIEELTKPQQATLLKETDTENIPQDEIEADVMPKRPQLVLFNDPSVRSRLAKVSLKTQRDKTPSTGPLSEEEFIQYREAFEKKLNDLTLKGQHIQPGDHTFDRTETLSTKSQSHKDEGLAYYDLDEQIKNDHTLDIIYTQQNFHVGDLQPGPPLSFDTKFTDRNGEQKIIKITNDSTAFKMEAPQPFPEESTILAMVEGYAKSGKTVSTISGCGNFALLDDPEHNLGAIKKCAETAMEFYTALQVYHIKPNLKNDGTLQCLEYYFEHVLKNNADYQSGDTLLNYLDKKLAFSENEKPIKLSDEEHISHTHKPAP